MKKTDLQTVSVVIPVHNGEKYLQETIRSVLNQTLKPFEIIVVDDGSTDKSIKITESFAPHINLIKNKNNGAASARNTGILKSKGEFLAFLDADDLWLPKKLEIQMDFLRSNRHIEILYSQAIQFYSPDLPGKIRETIKIVKEAQPFHVPGTLLLSKKSFLSIGLYNEEYETGENIDWYLRALDSDIEIHTLNKVLIRRRIHANNSSRFKKAEKIDYLKMARESILRKKKTKTNKQSE